MANPYREIERRHREERAYAIPEPTGAETRRPLWNQVLSLPFDALLEGLSALDYIASVPRAGLGRLSEAIEGQPWGSLGSGRNTFLGPAPSGRELLGQGAGEKGKLELADVPGTALEAVLDPAMWIGIGEVTKAGQVAGRAAGLANTARAAAAMGRKDLAEEAFGALRRMGLKAAEVQPVPRGLAQQAREGLRSGFSIGVPFGPQLPVSLFGGAVSQPVLRGLDAVGGRLSRMAEPLTRWLSPSGRLTRGAFPDSLRGGLAGQLGTDPGELMNELIALGRGERAIGEADARSLAAETAAALRRQAAARPQEGIAALKEISEAVAPYREQIARQFDQRIAAAQAAGQGARAAGLERAKTRALGALEIPLRDDPHKAVGALAFLGLEKGAAVEKVTQQVADLTAQSEARIAKRTAQAQKLEGRLRPATPGVVLPEARATEERIAAAWGRAKRLNAEDVARTAGRVQRATATAAAYGAIRDRLPPTIRQVADRLHAALGTSFAAEVSSGVKLKALVDNLMDYAPRRLSRDFVGWASKLNGDDPFYRMLREYQTTGRFTLERTPELRGLAVPVINDLARARGFAGDVFTEDVTEAVLRRLLEGAKARQGASVATGAITLFAMPAEVAGDGAVAVAKLVHQLQLGRAGGTEIAGRTKAAVLKALKGTDLETAVVPKAIADALTETHRVLSDRTQLHKAMRVVEKINGVYRLAVTQFFPGFHVRNVESNWFMMFLAGMRDPRYVYRAAQLQWRVRNRMLSESGEALRKGARLASDAEMATWRSAVEHGALGRGIAGEGAEMLPVPSSDSILGRAAGKARQAADWVTRKGTALEDNSKLALYLWGRDKGQTGVEAGRLAQKYLFDYSDLSWAEKRPGWGLRSLAYFYTYVRLAVPLLVGELGLRPQRLAALGHLTGAVGSRAEGRELMPPWLKRRVPMYLGRDEAGQDRLLSLGLPYENLLEFGTEGKGPGRGVEQVLAMAAPLPFKLPLQLIQGRDWRTGRNLREDRLLEAAIDKLPPVVQREVRAAQFVAPLAPTGRLSGSLPDLLAGIGVGTSPRPRTDLLLSSLAGANLTRLDVRRAELRTRLDQIEKALDNLESMDAGDSWRAKQLRTLKGRTRSALSRLP